MEDLKTQEATSKTNEKSVKEEEEAVSDEGDDDLVLVPTQDVSFSSSSSSEVCSSRTPAATTTSTEQTQTYSQRWTYFLSNTVHTPIRRFLRVITSFAAHNPITTIISIICFSFGIAGVGLMTNFYLVSDAGRLWTPANSPPVQSEIWIEDTFAPDPRYLAMLFHNKGDNVLTRRSVEQVLQSVDAVRSLEGYQDVVCNPPPDEQHPSCEIYGIGLFFDHSLDNLPNDDDTLWEEISAREFPNQMPISEKRLFGKPIRNNSNNTNNNNNNNNNEQQTNDSDDTDLLTSVQAFWTYFRMPDTDETMEWEVLALETVLNLELKDLYVEVHADRSFSDEFERAILVDIPLVPVVFFMMVTFTCVYFFRWHKVYSRSTLGLGAVVAILLSIVSAYGLMFCIGTPFTSMTQLLPYILFGIGLDDAFIIMGSFGRTDPHQKVEERIRITIEDVGVSIALTSITSTFAFALGLLSTIPAVDWLCLYAFPSVIFVFLYQNTFFVACIVLDERRIQQRRRDCCICITVPQDDEDGRNNDGIEDELGTSIVDQFMVRYAEFILQPAVKRIVIAFFCGLAAACAWSASKLRQEFQYTDVLPKDSYLTAFADSRSAYTTRKDLDMHVYFRHVNQSDPVIQQHMRDYIDELVDMDAVVAPPEFLWLDDVERYANFTKIQDLPLSEQVGQFLSVSVIEEVYGSDIVRDPNDGTILASRTLIALDNVDWENVQNQMRTYDDINRITNEQPTNQDREEDAFFCYTLYFNSWEFYSRSVDELMNSAIIGIVAVTVIAFFMIPHWSAAPIVFPTMCVLYIDLLGVMQWGGVTINAVSWVSLAMSIGLLVDFIMHVLLRYYEANGNRREKTVEMLQTMGSSILVGGISTFLGTVPLAFSQSEIFGTVFIAFLGLVSLGVSHGLILLPVILSTIGTEEHVPHHAPPPRVGETTLETGKDLEAMSAETPPSNETETAPNVNAETDFVKEQLEI